MIKRHKYTFVIAILIIVVLNICGLFEALNEKIYDNYILLNQSKSFSKELALVTIDDECINTFGQWPFDRAVHSRVLNILQKNHPCVVGVNLSFTEKRSSEEDQLLYKTLKSFSFITLALYVEIKSIPGASGQMMPVYVQSNETIYPDILHSHSYIQHSDKGTVRKFKPFIQLNNKEYNAYAINVARLYFQSTGQPLPEKLKSLFSSNDSNKEILIDYKRPPGLFKHYSYLDILNNKVPPDAFNNKIVLVGLTDQSLTSKYTTPFTGAQSLFSTPLELQAQIIDSLLHYRGLAAVPQWLVILFSVVIAVLFLLLIKNKTAAIQGIIFVLFIAGIVVVDFVLFKYTALWLAPALPLTLILFVFALSVYFTTTSLDKELVQTINAFKTTDTFPFTDIPDDVSSKVGTLKQLLNIIHEDRNTIDSILQGVNNGIIVFDKNGVIIWANARMLELIPDSLVLNMTVEALFKIDNIKFIKENISLNSFYSTEILINQLEFLCIINKIKSKKEHYVAILNDITELKQINRLKTDMVRMVSHELKNPLAAISLNAENITFIEDRKTVEQSAESILDTAQLLLDIINNFLNLSKLESNMTELDFQMADLNDVIGKSIELQNSIALSKNVSLLFEKQELPPVLMDTRQILIVINNFVSNAIKYSHPDSTVTIQTHLTNSLITVSVTDCGIGIPEDETEKVFSKFFRSRNNKEGNIEGTGLGLSIVSKIIELHRGKVGLKSQYGKGSTFSFSLPVQNQNL